ncbi:MAG TPA: YciI family protein [Pseudonocardia sp.]|nr:YciI family protein [Pseudonocardia sp.]
MICIELSFTDDPARLAARPAHRDQLRDLHERGVLHAAGPWGDDSGALLILDTDDAGAEAAVAADPYFTTPGVHVVAVRDWQPVVGPR